MADDNKRQPVPAGGAPIPGALEAANATPPAGDNGDASGDEGSEHTAADDGELVEARVLIDHGDHEPNDIIRAPAAEIARLKLAGVVDDHEDAVAFAKAG